MTAGPAARYTVRAFFTVARCGEQYNKRVNVTDDFSADGQLAKKLPGFRPRAAQRQMAAAVEQAITDQGVLVVEAGTGTGKTYAYLAPVLRAGRKTILSTASRALQDQLFARDLPAVAQALGFSGQCALLKGRANYLCLERLDQQTATGAELSRDALRDLLEVRRWASQTVNGDIAHCSAVAEESEIWARVTSTNDNCLGSDCPQFQRCFVVKARRRAMEADLVVVNHHLFLADMVVKDSGFAELIPHGDVLVFDEAHQLPDIAGHYFGEQVTSRQLLDLARDITLAYRTEVRDLAQLQKGADRLSQATRDLRLMMGNAGYRGNLRELLAAAAVQQSLQRLSDALELCAELAAKAQGRSALLDAVAERLTDLRARLQRVTAIADTSASYWYECSTYHFVLALTPLSVAERFRAVTQARPASWIFTSATLSVNDDLSHFTAAMGLERARTLLLASPFDYPRQALLYVPRGLPQPGQRDTARRLIALLKPVLEANQGRSFLLCTSYQMMRELAEGLRQQLTLPVLMQGEAGKGALLKQFVAAGNAVLVATASFWEGVDVRGDVLSCVVIDKLPFTAPDDPLLKAKMEACRLRGGDPFAEIQLPDAVITLKQGAGRLIRDSQDRGVLIICDSRLVMRNYGAIFLRSLPPAQRTRDLSRVLAFIDAGRAAQ